MDILADENVPRDVVAWLRSSGHNVLFVPKRNRAPQTWIG